MGFLRAGLFAGFVSALLAASCGGTQDVFIAEGGAPDASPEGGDSGTCRPEACPGTDSECSTRTCKANACATDLTAAGTALKAQKAGDCKQDQCDGAGAVTSVADDTDKPDDNNPCTLDGCKAGAITADPAPKGTKCGTSLLCDGAGSCVGCTAPSECPGTDTECQTRTCVANKCGFSNTPVGTVVSTQVPGDCMKSQCDGAGKVQAVVDNTDVPNDSKQCTSDLCTAGTPSNPPLASGTACTQGGGSVCNGAGTCVQCVTAATCPGTDTACRTRTCNANLCGFSFGVAGFKIGAQTAGDCQVNQCDGAGNIVSAADNTDVPNDANQCTSDACAAGVPSNLPTASGSACNQNGGTLCNGAGTCVQCITAATCPGTDTACRTRTCNANACGFSFAPAGTVTPTQTAGDCKENQCDGAGNIVGAAANGDVPVDGNQCTDDVCNKGVASNPPAASGTACTQGGGSLCNGAGTCVQCITAATCPGVDTECQTRSCTGNVCGMTFTPSGTAVTAQTPGDCQSNVCNGAGAVVTMNANGDVPVDGNQCTDDLCAAGVPSNPPKGAGSTCNQNGGVTCDGAGACVP